MDIRIMQNNQIIVSKLGYTVPTKTLRSWKFLNELRCTCTKKKNCFSAWKTLHAESATCKMKKNTFK